MGRFPPEHGPIEVALARPVEEIPAPGALPGGAVYQIKVDGWRLVVLRSRRGVELRGRRGTDLTGRFPDIEQAALAQLRPGCVLDGEVVIFRDGRFVWDALQLRVGGRARVLEQVRVAPASYVAFDLVALDGVDLRPRPLRERWAQLEQIAAGWRPPLQLVLQTTDRAEAERWFHDFREMGVEGLVVKGASTRYTPGRSWLKVKSRATTEVILGAVTGSHDAPQALIVGRFTPSGDLVMVGRSSLLNAGQAEEVRAVIDPADVEDHPWPARISGFLGGNPVDLARVDPTVVVEVAADSALQFGRYRHALRFVRVRPDVDVDEVATLSG